MTILKAAYMHTGKNILFFCTAGHCIEKSFRFRTNRIIIEITHSDGKALNEIPKHMCVCIDCNNTEACLRTTY